MSLVVRPAVPADAVAIASIYAAEVESGYATFEEAPPDVSEIAERMRRVMEVNPWLVAACAGEVAAYAYATPHRERSAYRFTVETTVYVARPHWRTGLGGALYDVLLRILEAQGYRVALAGISLPNEASVRMHESHGFAPAGSLPQVGFKFGRWHDVGWWSRPFATRADPPAEPVPFPVLRASPAFAALVGSVDSD